MRFIRWQVFVRPDLVSPIFGKDEFPIGLDQLEILSLNFGGGHSDNATKMDEMLYSAPKLISPSLYLPTRDLESYGIRGITHKYEFQRLTTFIIST
jgi:hypothetical protein